MRRIGHLWIMGVVFVVGACVIEDEIASHAPANMLTGGSGGSAGQAGSGGQGGDIVVAWQSLSPMNEARAEHTMTTLPDGRVLIAGGFGSGGNALSSAEIWDPMTQSFTLVAPMNKPRARHAATLMSNGKVLVMGGYDSPIETNTAEEYDPVSNAWTTIASTMNVARMYHAAIAHPNGKILVASGCCDNAYKTAETYDPVLQAFTSTPVMTYAHAAPTLTLMGTDMVLLVGNADITSAELYDFNSNAWSGAGHLQTPRNAHTATLLASGRVVVAGGVSGLHVTETVEVYHPETKQWETLPSLLSARQRHTAALVVVSGQEDILWVGGMGVGGVVLASCERSSGKPCSNLNVARGLHRASMVEKNGQVRVLITGGMDEANQPTSSVEWSAW